MNLYYTTVSGYNQAQPNPSSSLGGYKSSTPVVNADFGNIFDEISVMTIRNDRDEYRAIILCNEYSQEVTNVTIKVVKSEDSICTFKLATAVLNGKDKYNKPFMENVQTVNSRPFHAQFVDMTEDAVITIPTLQSGEQVGIWICRHIDQEVAKQQYNEVCEPDNSDPTGRMWKPIVYPKTESVDIVIGWD